MKLVESIMTKNPCYTVGKKIAVKGLMLHSVGCPQPRASAFINSWNRVDYTRACVHGFIDALDGTIYQTLPWNHRGWHCGSGKNGSGNDTHIGVEMCEPACTTYTGGATFKVADGKLEEARACAKRSYDAAVELFAMLCGKFGLDPLADGVIVSHAEGHKRGIASNHGDSEHLWRQLGLPYSMDGFRRDVKAALGGSVAESSSASDADSKRMQTAELKNLSDADVIAKVGTLFSVDQREGGILASVSLAQFILESGYGKSELAQNANNVFGMKKNLSGNTWGGSAWDGVSVYGKQTQEYVDGKKLRYEGLKGCTDYQKAVQIIKDGGYATSPDYVEKLCTIIERWELTKWDVKDAVSVADGGGMANGDCPFLVKVSIPDLNIRKGAGTNTGKTGRHTGVGVFTVEEVRQGKGSEMGWGRLKSGAGWIALSFCERV